MGKLVTNVKWKKEIPQTQIQKFRGIVASLTSEKGFIPDNKKEFNKFMKAAKQMGVTLIEKEDVTGRILLTKKTNRGRKKGTVINTTSADKPKQKRSYASRARAVVASLGEEPLSQPQHNNNVVQSDREESIHATNESTQQTEIVV